MRKRFLNHDHLNQDVVRIEYIECDTEADMVWKEIYYINLFYNKSSTNVQDVYIGGVTNLSLNDGWKLYKKHGKQISDKEQSVIPLDEVTKLFVGYDVKNLINVVSDEKINSIGDDKYSLSKKWFYYAKDEQIARVKNNLNNFFRHRCNSKSGNTLWTTYSDLRFVLKGKGYSKGFVPLRCDVDDKFRNRTSLAFVANSFLPVIKHSVSIDEDGFALSEMLQFIWRSAIRDKKEIFVYIPSIRMRRLLTNWIVENSPK